MKTYRNKRENNIIVDGKKVEPNELVTADENSIEVQILIREKYLEPIEK